MTTATFIALAVSSGGTADGAGDLWGNVLSGATGAIVTFALGLVALQWQFRENARQRKRVIYAEFLSEVHNYLSVINRIVLRAFRDAVRSNIRTYLFTNEFPELSEAQRGVNVRMAALSFVAPKEVQREAATFLMNLDADAYFEEIAGLLQGAGPRLSDASEVIEERAWGTGPAWSKLQRTLTRDADAWKPAPDPRTVVELMAGKPRPADRRT